MQRYFAKEKTKDTFILHERDNHHIKNVMRCNINDHIEVVYDRKIYLCNIDNMEPLSLSVIKTTEEDRDINIALTIAIGLVQEQKFDLILQKLTELGVSKIIPLKMERSVVKLDQEKYNKKRRRWETICKEASEQSHRTNIPEITNMMTIKELLNYNCHTKLVCSLNKEANKVTDYLLPDCQEILFVIGPEGGISPQEEQLMNENDFNLVSLGKRVMRVETATFYVASIINYIYGW